MKRNSLDLTAICFAWILLWALLKSPKRFLTDVCVCFSMYCWLVVWNHRILCSIQGGGPPVISWFINPINYSYKYHKP